jgi:hypothetical protein
LQVTQSSGPKKTIGSILKDTVKANGFFGLFRGLEATLAREVPGNFAMFFGYEATKKALTPAGQSSNDLPAWKVLLSGIMTGDNLGGFLLPVPTLVVSQIFFCSLFTP